MKIEDQIKVMQAFSEGKSVEYRHMSQSYWESCPRPIWNWGDGTYRIKEEPPKPRVIYVRESEATSGANSFFGWGYSSRDAAIANRGWMNGKVSKFIEVIE